MNRPEKQARVKGHIRQLQWHRLVSAKLTTKSFQIPEGDGIGIDFVPCVVRSKCCAGSQTVFCHSARHRHEALTVSE